MHTIWGICLKLPRVVLQEVWSIFFKRWQSEAKFLLFCFFLVVFTSESGNVLTYMKNIHFLSSLERLMETSWRNSASRHRDNVHVYDNWSVWGYFRVDQPTSTCFRWYTSISVYLQRTSDRSNSHERRCSTRNLDDMHTIWGICLKLPRVVLQEVWSIFFKRWQPEARFLFGIFLKAVHVSFFWNICCWEH